MESDAIRVMVLVSVAVLQSHAEGVASCDTAFVLCQVEMQRQPSVWMFRSALKPKPNSACTICSIVE